MISEALKAVVATLKPAFDASLDPICVVDEKNQIVYMSLSMKNFIGVRPRDLEKGVVFCDELQLAACKDQCQIVEALRTGNPLRLDEAPATKEAQKLRVSLRVVPLYETPGAKPMGAVLCLRDSTGEILLQAKYHKMLELLKEKEAELAEVEARLESAKKSLRGARTGLR